MTVYGIHQALESSAKIVLNNLVKAVLKANQNLKQKSVLFVVCKDTDLTVNDTNALLVNLDSLDNGSLREHFEKANQLLVIHTKNPLPNAVF